MLEKFRFLVQIFENLDFGQYFNKISILVKILENLDFDLNFWKVSILAKSFEISILVKNLNWWKSRFCQNFRKSRILLQLSKHLIFCSEFF